MIIEPRDALLAMMDDSKIRLALVDELRLASKRWNTDSKNLVIWCPDWFFESYVPLANAVREASGDEPLALPLLLGVGLLPSSRHPERGNLPLTDDRMCRFIVELRPGVKEKDIFT